MIVREKFGIRLERCYLNSVSSLVRGPLDRLTGVVLKYGL